MERMMPWHVTVRHSLPFHSLISKSFLLFCSKFSIFSLFQAKLPKKIVNWKKKMAADLGDVVLDCGSGWIRAGFAGENHPKCIMDARVGRPRAHHRLRWQDTSCFLGQQIEDFRGLLDVRRPIEQGVIVHWDDMERLWSHALVHQLGAVPEECRVLLTETPLNPRGNRQRSVEVLLESLNCRGAFLASQAVLALYASGRTSGLVLDCGHGVTHWVPVVEGYALPHGIARMGYAGADLDAHLAALLARNGYLFATDGDRDVVRTIKEKHCYVALNLEEQRPLQDPWETHTLPDGTTVQLGPERYLCAEALFDPSLMELSSVGVGRAGSLAVDKCHRKSIQNRMYGNVVLTGGTTLLKGFRERVQAELEKHVAAEGGGATREEVKVVAPPNRKYAAWIGGAIVASLSTFERLWITKEEYEEYGANIVSKKCF